MERLDQHLHDYYGQIERLLQDAKKPSPIAKIVTSSTAIASLLLMNADKASAQLITSQETIHTPSIDRPETTIVSTKSLRRAARKQAIKSSPADNETPGTIFFLEDGPLESIDEEDVTTAQADGESEHTDFIPLISGIRGTYSGNETPAKLPVLAFSPNRTDIVQHVKNPDTVSSQIRIVSVNNNTPHANTAEPSTAAELATKQLITIMIDSSKAEKASPEQAQRALPETIQFNSILSEIHVESLKQSSYSLDRLVASVEQLLIANRDYDSDLPDDLPSGTAKVYLQNELTGIASAVVPAERTAPVERIGTANAVASVYAMSELYQQLVETEFPQYAGSVLRVRDLFSPYHRGHRGDEADLSSAMEPGVTWYSDGPIMDMHSPNYDPEFTKRFLELASRFTIDGQRAIRSLVYADREVIDYLNSVVGPGYASYQAYHPEHIHFYFVDSGTTYYVDPADIPMTSQEDLRIWSEGVQISDDQIRQMHGSFIDFVTNDNFVVESANKDRPAVNVAQDSRDDIDTLDETGTLRTGEVADTDNTETKPQLTEITIDDTATEPLADEDTPEVDMPTYSLEDVRPVDIETYWQLVLAGDLPDPNEYKLFLNGETVSVERSIELTEQYVSMGYDISWAEKQFLRLSTDEIYDLLKIAGIPDYDIPNFMGIIRGESSYFVQIAGDRERTDGPAVGLGQHLERYLTSEMGYELIDMFDPLSNVLEMRQKYLNSWQINGFEHRFDDWTSAKNKTEGFLAGVDDGIQAQERNRLG